MTEENSFWFQPEYARDDAPVIEERTEAPSSEIEVHTNHSSSIELTCVWQRSRSSNLTTAAAANYAGLWIDA